MHDAPWRAEFVHALPTVTRAVQLDLEAPAHAQCLEVPPRPEVAQVLLVLLAV